MVMLRDPVAAVESMVMVAVGRLVIELKDTEFTVIPEPEKATVGVAVIPVPVIVTSTLVAPAP